MNLGLRYEYEGATDRADNRNVRGFDPDAAVAIAAAAEAAYAAHPIAELPASGFNVRGGLLFAGDGSRGFWNADKNNFSRGSASPTRSTRRRCCAAGSALHVAVRHLRRPPARLLAADTARRDARQRPDLPGTLATPFPPGSLEPPGSSLGADTFLGRQLDRFAYVDGVRNEQNARWASTCSASFRPVAARDRLRRQSHGYDLSLEQNDQHRCRAQYLSTVARARPGDHQLPDRHVANPFAGLLPGETLNGATTAAAAAPAAASRSSRTS